MGSSSKAWSSGRIAFASTQRNGKDFDIYVAAQAEPASAARVATVDGKYGGHHYFLLPHVEQMNIYKQNYYSWGVAYWTQIKAFQSPRDTAQLVP